MSDNTNVHIVTFPALSELTIRFTKDAQPVLWGSLPDHIIARLASHGLKQLVDDKMAGAEMDGDRLVKNDKPMKIDGAYMHDGAEVFGATLKRLESGEWSERKVGNKVSSLPWPQRWLYGVCEDKAPAFILAGKLVVDGKVLHDVTNKTKAAMRELLFTADKFAKWRELQLKNLPPEPAKPEGLTQEELDALMDDDEYETLTSDVDDQDDVDNKSGDGADNNPPPPPVTPATPARARGRK